MEQTMEKENIMGTMPEGKLLLKLAMPMIFSVLVSSLYNIVDSIFVGRMGQNALTAISLGLLTRRYQETRQGRQNPRIGYSA